MKDFIDDASLANLGRLIERALADGGETSPPIGRADRNGPLPASFAQQRLWFLDRLQPGSPAYNVPITVRLDGPLDLGALRRALDEVVRRHEILRTTFGDDRGIPRQVIAEPSGLPLPVEDFSDLPDDVRLERAMGHVLRDAALPFDLKRGPLVRAGLSDCRRPITSSR